MVVIIICVNISCSCSCWLVKTEVNEKLIFILEQKSVVVNNVEGKRKKIEVNWEAGPD